MQERLVVASLMVGCKVKLCRQKRHWNKLCTRGLKPDKCCVRAEITKSVIYKPFLS